MAKGLYLTSDGQVLVEYGKRRRVPIPSAQYKANGYKPPCDKLPPEVPRKARKEFAHAAGVRVGLDRDVIEDGAFGGGRPLPRVTRGWPSASGPVRCPALTADEQTAPAPTRLGFHRLSWPDTAPRPFA